jgi:CelD/BcsL family acetyltransferase involved in cellulose biosynthesis
MAAPRTEIDLVSPLELTPEVTAAWSALQAGSRELANPFLSPYWPRTVAEIDGPDRRARVAVFHQGGVAKGFLACRVGHAKARPVGAPMCDYQGVVGAPDLEVDPQALLKALGVCRLDFTHLLESQQAFTPYRRGEAESLVINLDGGFDAYAQAQRAHSDILVDTAKKRRKLEREKGEVVFTARSTSREAFEQLIGWKRAQYRATKQTDIFAAGWPLEVLNTVWQRADSEFGGTLFTLHVGGELAAAHFALEGGGVLHAWFIAHDEGFARYSPGVVLIADILRWAAAEGIHELDLGPGDYRFKQQLANARRGVVHGFVGRPSARSFAKSVQYGVRGLAESLPLGKVSALPGKAMRRYDVITGLR